MFDIVDAGFVALIFFAYYLAVIFGWWMIVRGVEKEGTRPFNWRIIWAPAYFAWIDRRTTHAEDAL